MLLQVEVDFISEEQSHKKNVIVAYGIGFIEMILALSIKIIALYIQTFIV